MRCSRRYLSQYPICCNVCKDSTIIIWMDLKAYAFSLQQPFWGGRGGGGGRFISEKSFFNWIIRLSVTFFLTWACLNWTDMYISMNYGIKSIFTTQKTAKLKRKHLSRISIYNTFSFFFRVEQEDKIVSKYICKITESRWAKMFEKTIMIKNC